MKCDECGTREANVHLTQIAQSETKVFHLCEQCARRKGISITIEHDNGNSPKQEQAGELEIMCPGCRLLLSEFRAKGRLGCSRCYNAFEDEIDELLLQVHGSKVHRGKAYSAIAGIAQGTMDIEQLRGQLERAIKNEEFELAAAIRDAINGVTIRNAKIPSGVEGN